MTRTDSTSGAAARRTNAVLLAVSLGVLGLLCAGAVYAAWPGGGGGGQAGDPLTGTPSVAAPSPPGTDQPAGGATAQDATAEFRAYILSEYEREPAWLGRVDQVAWAGDGGLRARTTPGDIEAQTVALICLGLSAYVAEAGQQWHGVGVHAADGTELLRRNRLDDTTTCAF